MNERRRTMLSNDSADFQIGTSRDFPYTGSIQDIVLPAGYYLLQCWGAEGGSNAANSNYGITSQPGGKGGYSEAVLSLNNKQKLYVSVGAAGTSTNATNTYSDALYVNDLGSNDVCSSGLVANMFYPTTVSSIRISGRGGGSTDIRTKTAANPNTDTTSRNSRFIVAGGGSGGAGMYYTDIRYSSTKSTLATGLSTIVDTSNIYPYDEDVRYFHYLDITNYLTVGKHYYIVVGDYNHMFLNMTVVASNGIPNGDEEYSHWITYSSSGISLYAGISDVFECRLVLGCNKYFLEFYADTTSSIGSINIYQANILNLTDNQHKEGVAGGGIKGLGDSGGTKTTGGSSSILTNYLSVLGGGGWKLGNGYGTSYEYLRGANFDLSARAGGGSGFIYNGTYPSNGTGLIPLSGYTIAGDLRFLAPDGLTEIGHSGDGFARITRLENILLNFGYTGEVQSVTLPSGTYKLECWGAQGGSYNDTYSGGKGGYSIGTVTLSSETTLYIYVGGKGTGGTSTGAKAGGFNGGGLGYSTSSTYIECGGGGSSDIRIGQDSLYSRVIVAGGGGGAGSYSNSYRYSGGAGGGTTGLTPSQYSNSYKAGTGGSLIARGTSYYGSTANSTSYGTLASFGVGAGAKSATTSYNITGGGGGWYGGGYSQRGAGGGGSGYVYTSSTASNYPSGCLLNSSYYLSNASTSLGNTSFPSISGSTEIGHEGNGYVRITKIS